MTVSENVMGQPELCSTGKPGAAMSVDAARLRSEAVATCLSETETLALDMALDRVLAETGLAQVALPPFDDSAMDGYALNSAALSGTGPWSLTVAGRIAAGDTRGIALVPGSAARIFTGAPIPDGADCVVMQEAVRRSEARILLHIRPVTGGQYPLGHARKLRVSQGDCLMRVCVTLGERFDRHPRASAETPVSQAPLARWHPTGIHCRQRQARVCQLESTLCQDG